VTGVMVRHADDPRQAAHAFERLLDDPALRLSMGQAGRRRAVEEFSYDGLARRLARSLGALA
ncbi:MAG: glycosyltransferase, partial [Ilumatobacteraceae bacterium]